jgi:hypothetical protein
MSGKIGIFAPCQVGDIITATAVLKHKDEIWPGKDIVWFCNEPFTDALKFSPVSEIRSYGPNDFNACLKKNMGVGNGMNRMDLEKARSFDTTSDLEDGYFPLTWMVSGEQRKGLDYPMISKRIFGVNSTEWRPFLCFSSEEREMVAEIARSLPHKKTVMIENAPTNYSSWGDASTRILMDRCRAAWGPTNFVFASGGHRSGCDMTRFFDDVGCISISNLTARQASLFNEHCDLFAGLAGALTFATSCWGAKPTPKIILTGSEILGARGIANGKIEIVAGEVYLNDSDREFDKRLTRLLSTL